MLLEGKVGSSQSPAMLICISKALSHSQLQRECFGPPKEYYLGQYPISCMVIAAAGYRKLVQGFTFRMLQLRVICITSMML